MASFNSSMQALYSTVDTSLSAVTTVANTAVKALNEGSARLNEWTLMSQLEREVNREKILTNRINNKILELAREDSKRTTELANDTQLNGIYESMRSDVDTKIKEALAKI